ncbi:hypothetical protein COV18_02125 [Candidatus Woesearchaeota archaeon CG10_big_fil_rev_8_21_14_0_10_37_12]|nr:MAG: hypothetical protein COV18_02125 [Candidatus Woesearchaeota archaeon CG10_big_fil_rev_8_21_14_0_10_37_12]
MKKQNKPNIAIIHSETRSYRVPLFDKLSKAYNTVFYFTHGGGWSKQYPSSKEWRYCDLRSYNIIGYKGDFSPSIIKWLFKRKHDVIITSGLASFATHVSFLIAKITGKKLILWDETWEWPRTFGARIAKLYAKFIVKHADACIAAGSKAKEFYVSFGAKPKKVFIANNCAVDLLKKKTDSQKIAELKKKYNLKNKKIVLYLGRIIKYKGLDYLIRAFAKIEKSNPDAILIIGGPDCGWEAHCKKLAKNIGLKNYVFIGSVPHSEVKEHYLLADVFVLPSRTLYENNVVNESWGLAINEALSLGIPIVSTTAVAAGYDMIKNGKNGFLVKERDVSAISNAIQSTLKNNIFMRKEARKTFERWNDYDKMVKGFKDAIEYVVKEK